MKITFFSTNSSTYSEKDRNVKEFPSREEIWTKFTEEYPEFEISFVVQKPGHFLLDNAEPSSKIKTIICDENQTNEQIAEEIASLSPDLAVSITYWETPYDWLSLRDSVIANILREKKIRTVSHNIKAALYSFDKRNTRNFLISNSFNSPKGIYIHHELYWAERNNQKISFNAYKEYIHSEIKKLKLPLVIKDTTGLSSYGMDVCTTYDQAFHILRSKKNNGDRIIEEFLDGYSFGIEVYGSNKKYTLSPLFINSVNQFGLTSPKQNVKLGPVMNFEKFRVFELYRDIERLSTMLKFNGICQVDLIFSKNKWYIIEINSRVSGMTETCAASMNLTLPELFIYSSFLGKQNLEQTPAFQKIQEKIKRNYVMNMKFPILSDEKLEKLYRHTSVQNVNQIHNLEAKQLREEGYSEIIFGKTKTLNELLFELGSIKNEFGSDIEPVFYNNALQLAEEIK